MSFVNELAEAKAYLRVDTADDDALIADLIDAAHDHIENMTGVVVQQRTDVISYDAFAATMPIYRSPLQSITSIGYTDATGASAMLDTTQYYLRKWNGVPTIYLATGFVWPCFTSYSTEVLVTGVVGYASASDVPAVIRLAVQRLVSNWYDNRGPFVDGRTSAVPQDVDAMLARYRLSVA